MEQERIKYKKDKFKPKREFAEGFLGGAGKALGIAVVVGLIIFIALMFGVDITKYR